MINRAYLTDVYVASSDGTMEEDGHIIFGNSSCSSFNSIKNEIKLLSINEYDEFTFSSEEEETDDESFADGDLLIFNALCRIDSKNHINQHGQRFFRSANTFNRQNGHKRKCSFDDPLLARFLQNKARLHSNPIKRQDRSDSL